LQVNLLQRKIATYPSNGGVELLNTAKPEEIGFSSG
jgi:hypothetical protein